MATFTDSEFTDWLADDANAKPVVLVIAEHSAGSVHIGTYAYNSIPADSPSNQLFEGILSGSISISESMRGANVGSISIIDDGTHDDWIGFKWIGQSIKVYLGDARWRFSNFRLMIDGLNAGITAPSIDRFEFGFLDSTLSLDEEIGADLKPLSIASPFNVPAVRLPTVTMFENTISFTTNNQIDDSASGFGIFNVGDLITVVGTASNDDTYKILTVTDAQIITVETTIVNESAGTGFTITAGSRYKVHDGAIFAAGIYDNGVIINGSNIEEFYFDVGEFTLTDDPVGQITANVTRPGSTGLSSILDVVEYMKVRPSFQFLDIDDALLPATDNISTTIMTAFNSAVVTQPTVDSNYVVQIENDTNLIVGAGAKFDIAALSSAGIEDETTFIITGEMRHIGTGGGSAPWYVELWNNNDDFMKRIGSGTLEEQDDEWIPFQVSHIYHSTDLDGVKYFTVIENYSGAGGGVEIRNLQAYKASIQYDLATISDIVFKSDALGIFIAEPESAKSLLDKIVLDTVGGYYFVNSLGKMVFGQIDVPATSTFELTKDHIKEGGMTLDHTDPPLDKYTLKSVKNWKVQSADGLASSVSAAFREQLSREWVEVFSENILTGYPIVKTLTGESYSVTDGAQDEVDRRQVIRSVQREVYDIESYLSAAQVVIGQTITVTYSKYGFDAGKDMVVIGLDRELGKKTIDILVWG